MNFHDPLILITKALELTRYSVAENPWSARVPDSVLVDNILRITPGVCANVTTPIDLGICIDAYCSTQSPHGTVHPDVDLKVFQPILKDVLKSRGISGLPQRAVIGKILSTYKDQLCRDQPPPPGTAAPVAVPVPVQEPVAGALPNERLPHIGNCGYVVSASPEAKAGGLAVLGGFLGILAFRAIQTATGAFFLFIAPEDHMNRYTGT